MDFFSRVGRPLPPLSRAACRASAWALARHALERMGGWPPLRWNAWAQRIGAGWPTRWLAASMGPDSWGRAAELWGHGWLADALSFLVRLAPLGSALFI